MRRFGRAIIYILLLVAAPVPALAQEAAGLLDQAGRSLQAGDNEQALLLTERAAQVLWNQAGLSLAKVVLTLTAPEGYGVYEPRIRNQFQPRDMVHLYLEPRGFKLVTINQGIYRLGLSLDLVVSDSEGKVLWSQNGFLEKRIISHRFIREMYLPVSLDLGQARSGEYLIKATVNDLESGQRVTARVPIEVE